MKNYHDFFQDQYQTCVMANDATGCGEMTGSVPQAASVSDVGTFRESVVDAYWTQYQEKYNKFVHGYTLGQGGAAYEGDYNVFTATQLGKVWGFSNWNSTWTRDNEMIGPGIKRKGSVRRSLVHLQVSISSQALLFVTRTASSNNWFFAEKLRNLLLVAFVLAQIVTSVIGWIDFNGYSTVLL
ncbi:hypothetical protein PRIC2_011770 [Phytophthora ramorum]